MREVIFGRREAVLAAIDKLCFNDWYGTLALRTAVEALRQGSEVTVRLQHVRAWPFFGKRYQEITVDDSSKSRCYYNRQPAKP